jgi:transcriptional regulator with XRE-family HTH domain
MKKLEREKALKLRSEGKSIRDIAKILNVSKGTVSIWCRNVKLTPEQIEHLNNRNPIYENSLYGAKARAEKAREVRRQHQNDGKKRAKDMDPLHMAGCMLYWAEGAKSKNTCKISNTDYYLLRMFIKFLTKEFGITKKDLTVRINCYTNNGKSLKEIEDYWLKQLGLCRYNLIKSCENKVPISSKRLHRKNKHIFGTCDIRVKKSTMISQHIFGAIQEYANMDHEFCLF